MYQKKLHQIVGVAFIVLFLVGCGMFGAGISSGVPAEAKEKALSIAKDSCVLFVGDRCQDYSIGCSEEKEITNADKANNIEERWCLTVEYLRSSPALGSGDWRDIKDPYLLVKRNGIWEAKYGVCNCSESRR